MINKLICVFILFQLSEKYIEPIIKHNKLDGKKSEIQTVRMNFTGVIRDELFEISLEKDVIFKDTLNTLKYSSGYAPQKISFQIKEIKNQKLKLKNLTSGYYTFFRLNKNYQNITFYQYGEKWEFIYGNQAIIMK